MSKSKKNAMVRRYGGTKKKGLKFEWQGCMGGRTKSKSRCSGTLESQGCWRDKYTPFANTDSPYNPHACLLHMGTLSNGSFDWESGKRKEPTVKHSPQWSTDIIIRTTTTNKQIQTQKQTQTNTSTNSHSPTHIQCSYSCIHPHVQLVLSFTSRFPAHTGSTFMNRTILTPVFLSLSSDTIN